MNKGFTLIEVLVVASITVLITGFLITNFSRARVDLNQVTLMTVDAIREAQSQALSGALVRGVYHCGYGIHFDATGYVLFAGPDSSAVDCTTQSKLYSSGVTVVRQALLPNNVLEFVLPVPDIYFEPPNPTTSIGGSSASGASTVVAIRRKGSACPSADCRTITVTTAGRIQTP